MLLFRSFDLDHGLSESITSKSSTNSVSNSNFKVQWLQKKAEWNARAIAQCFYDACKAGDVEEALKQIVAGAPLNGHNDQGVTGLHLASASGNPELVIRLIELGADVNAPDSHGQNHTPIMSACAADSDAIETLLDLGANIHHQDVFGCGVLHRSASSVRNAVCRLLQRGADVTLRNKDGETALHSATTWGNLEGIYGLLDAGADINAINHRGETSLFKAVKHNTRKVMLHLIERGADVDLADARGQSPLGLAAALGRYDTGAVLIAHGADTRGLRTPSATGESLDDNDLLKGLPPLHAAAMAGLTRRAIQLTETVADLDAVYCQRTAVDMAVEAEEHETAAALVACRARRAIDGLLRSQSNDRFQID